MADGAGLALATADGRLLLHEVQPAGGRAMDGSASGAVVPASSGRR